MARIRTVKPDFWTSEDIAAVSRNARLLFIGLLNHADDVGNGPASARGLKMKVFPGDADVTPAKIETWMQELDQELIGLYDAEGKQYYHVMKWHHQKISNPQKPKFPSFTERSRNGPVTLAPDSRDSIVGKVEDSAKKSAHKVVDFYLTFKKRRLQGPMLVTFDKFWKAFNYKKDRAKAADAWLDIDWPEDREAKNVLFGKILSATKAEASDRRYLFEQRKTPIYPEGWLTHKRWEDEG